MSVNVIAGGSGYGKTTYMANGIIKDSIDNPDRNYIFIVPEQFTMQTQKDMCNLHPNGGLMNIDILSFKRLAYRVFEEISFEMPEYIDDAGKNLILRRVIDSNRENLIVYKNSTKYMGFITEIKSVLSEFSQYCTNKETIDEMSKKAKEDGKELFAAKLSDISLIYEKFEEAIRDKYTTKEDLLKLLTKVVSKSSVIKNSDIYIDGFTGFTPDQYELLCELAANARNIFVSVAVDPDEMNGMGEYGFDKIKDSELFKLSKETINSLSEVANSINEKLVCTVISDGENSRLHDNKELSYLEKNLFRKSLTKPFEDVNCKESHINIVNCENPLEECLYVASDIAKRLDDNRYRDFAVVTGALDKYSGYISEAFKKYNIPVFVDDSRSILKNPCVNAIRQALLVADENFSKDSVLSYLKSGMSFANQTEIYIFENYVNASGIKGFRAYKKSFLERKYKPQGMNDDLIRIADSVRERFITLFTPVYKELVKKDSTVKDKTLALYELVVNERMELKLEELKEKYEKLEKNALVLECEQIYKFVIDLFDKMVLLMGDDVISVRDYAMLLDSGFLEVKVSVIPPSNDLTVIGDLIRTRLDKVKYLYVLGVNDGVIPSGKGAKGLLNPADRVYLEKNRVKLAPDIKENAFIERFYLYMLMTKPRIELSLAYSKKDMKGETLLPSYLVDVISEMFPKCNRITYKFDRESVVSEESAFNYLTKNTENLREMIEENENYEVDLDLISILRHFSLNDKYDTKYNMLRNGLLYNNRMPKLSSDTVDSLYGKDISMSVTRVESFAKCPFAYYLQYGLRLNEIREYDITSIDYGVVYHDCLENFFKLLMEYVETKGVSLSDVEDSVVSKILNGCIDKVMAENAGTYFDETARNRYFYVRIKRILNKSVDMLLKQLKSGVFSPKYEEYTFGDSTSKHSVRLTLKDGSNLTLKGKIDRVDVATKDGSTYVKIIDYKSGKKEFNTDDVNAGTDIQMLFYMDAFLMCEGDKDANMNLKPGAVLYFNIDDPWIKEEDFIKNNNNIDECLKNEFTMTGVVNAGVSDIIGDGVKIPKKENKKMLNYDDDTFLDLLKNVREGVKEKVENIKDGECEILPVVKSKDETPCSYCKYLDICRYQPRFGINSCRKAGGDENGN